jgi:asparagine synthase (glutamine-hydrolysing)
MCGLAGLYDTKGLRSYDPVILERMIDVIAHRGPDGSGIHNESGVALGHRRLSVIDPAGGAQPMHSADRRISLVYNGEIYNFHELRDQLESQGARFTTRSDTEVLLHGWRTWGERLLTRLNGMFAFALWDSAEHSLVLARDKFGKKPMHYALLDDGTLAFGSEIKSLLCVPELNRTIDLQAVADFFAYAYVPDPKTIYRAVRKLPPAHLLVARKGRAPQIRPYWNLLDTLAPSEPSEHTLIEHLSRAVDRRLMADVPLGALLSGGVDSSAVVALMAGSGGRPTRTFSIAFGEREFDESAYAAQVAERYSAAHDVRQLSPEDFSLIPRLPQIYDEPFGDVSAIPTFAVCQQARARVTVALSGDGGDEALAGYRRYAFHAAEERARAYVPSTVRGPVFSALADAYPRGAWLPRPLRAASTLRELSFDPATAYVRMVSALPNEVRLGLLSRQFVTELGGYDPDDVVREHFNVNAPLDPVQRAQYADVMTYLPGDILTKVDRASMANSLELRSPMLDPEFFAWSFNLPTRAKLTGGGGGKRILKRALESRLPKDLLYRRKQGFTVPLARWFRGPLRGQVLALARSPCLVDDGMVDPGAVRHLATDHVAGLQDNSRALWLLWVFNAFRAAERHDVRPPAATTQRRPAPAPP